MMMMKTIALVAFAALAAAAPQRNQRNRFINQFDEFGNQIYDEFGNLIQQRVQFVTDSRINRDFIPIIAETRSEPENGNYAFSFQADNGILRSESGTPGANGATNQEGEWTVTHPNGETHTMRFQADEFGARFDGSALPVGPEMPAHALEQLRRAEEERAAGITHDGQWDPIRYGGGQVNLRDDFRFIN